ncbi:membrane protein [Vogesella sp. EB]|uniref:sulfite exporter TauE/SafE family protein n=1 Tax=Vogesella sp. EB TaxID=1526735 RepID=UPI00064D1AAA|nr:sulfite exporter TauE/SafE family protein [Vogesella sp. EB]KMJ52448.1 membrane protein [Vogesella sp. EB]
MDLLLLFATLLLGALLGAVGGLFGIGGGIIAIPLLVLAYHQPQALAQGTALVMIVPNVLLAFWRYRQRHPFPLRTALAMGAGAMLATYPAARLAVALDQQRLQQVFAAFLLWLAYYFWRQGRRARPQAAQGWPQRYLPAVGVLGGACGGLFSVGSGIIAAPLLVRGFGLPQAVAQGMALALVVPSALVALLTYAGAGQVQWATGIALAVGGLSTISWGVALAHRLPEARLKQCFAALLLLTALLLWCSSGR